jgi:hypothetical protein
MRTCALIVALLLAGCRSPVTGEETEGASSSSTGASSSSTGEAVDRCVDVVCGAAATCDGHDGRCYCDPDHHGDPDVACATYPDYCAEAKELLGHGVCVFNIPDEATWIDNSQLGVEADGLRWMSKYLAPIDPASPLPTLFGDRSEYNLHLCMLQEGFTTVLPDFTNADYLALVYYRATRTMIAGSVYELVKEGLPVRYVFTVEVPAEAYELLTQAEVYSVYRLLQDRFAIGELGYFPRTSIQQGSALAWEDAGMPVVFNAGVMEPKPMKCE